jgi:hypothetical protein
MRRRIGLALALAAWVAWFPAVLFGQEAGEGDEPATAETQKTRKKVGKPAKEEDDAQSGEATGDGTDDLFAAVKKKKIDVRFVPQNAALASLTIVNTTDQPVKVRIPVVVAGTPTVPAGTNATTFFATFGTAPPQTVGGVTSSPGQDVAGGESKRKKSPARSKGKGDEPPKATVLTLPPAEPRIVVVACVCLEFGKPDPLPVLPYTVVEIEKASKKPEVKATLEKFAQGKFDREIAQLAAWHFNCGMTWEQLAEIGVFSNEKLNAAMKAAEQVEKEVKAKSKEKVSKAKNKDKEKAKKPAGKNEEN